MTTGLLTFRPTLLHSS